MPALTIKDMKEAIIEKYDPMCWDDRQEIHRITYYASDEEIHILYKDLCE